MWKGRPKSQGVTINMAEHSIDRKEVHHHLKIARTKLFEQLLKHPKNTRLALTVKLIDNQISNCTEWIRKKEKSAETESQALFH